MNKYKKAYQDISEGGTLGRPTSPESWATIRELVNRASPMKPIKRSTSSKPQCPSCGSQEVRQEQDGDWDRRNNYCPDCGQALDWSDKE